MLNYKHIVIEGNIGAGKTTLTKFLAKSFNGSILLEEFEENNFLKDFYNDKDFILHAEVQFILDRSKQLFKFHNKQHNLIFTDYIPYKSLIFSKMNLDNDDFALVENLVNSLFRKIPQPDLMIFLKLPINKLKENILLRGREYETNISLNYLQKVDDAYINFLKKEHNFPILILNANDIDLKNPILLKDKFYNIFNTKFDNRVKKIEL